MLDLVGWRYYVGSKSLCKPKVMTLLANSPQVAMVATVLTKQPTVDDHREVAAVADYMRLPEERRGT